MLRGGQGFTAQHKKKSFFLETSEFSKEHFEHDYRYVEALDLTFSPAFEKEYLEMCGFLHGSVSVFQMKC